ncbi:hypothetical protein [Erythrobacter rubeus]|uniref:Uncharacterized protein n=1 Tax=Erythrobacter rubeus TaxID=2760803 RepID=A0ABR8KW68_9SPHN|nr:hypothetical protein [Erythrobacter rubeus]MBD2842472.1 hypothetical protein [Erythrobacter rubeus]
MRAHTYSTRFLNGFRKAALLATAVSVIANPAIAAAQGSPGTFSLPEPTPTPTPAPQGPVDERDGVVLGPVTIPENRNQEPEASSLPAPTLSPAPAPAAEPSSAPPTTPPIRAQEVAPSQQAVQQTLPQTGTSLPNAQAVPPAAENPSSSLPAVTEGEVTTDTPSIAAPSAGAGRPTELEVREVNSAGDNGEGLQSYLVAALIALLLALVAIGVWAWRRKASAASRSSGLARGVTDSSAASGENVADASRSAAAVSDGRAVTTAHDPVHIDLQLDIVTAQRSVMNFSVEYRIAICNRSGHAVRDISIDAALTSASKNSNLAAPKGAGQAQEIERIGPHQSRTVTGEARLPLGQIQGLRQGQTPLFVPLLHITVKATGLPERTRTFVVGAPSAASQARLHPIPLDTPPGSLPGLRAQEIKQNAVPEAA